MAARILVLVPKGDFRVEILLGGRERKINNPAQKGNEKP
jgi:hypothetical protein